MVVPNVTRLMNANEDFAFLSLDIDHFRRFNERFGYALAALLVPVEGFVVLNKLF